MIPTCLQNLVTLKDCAPTSGPVPVYYLDDVQGITFEMVAAAAQSATPTGPALAKRLVEQATDYVLADVYQTLLKRFIFRDSLELILPDPWKEAYLPPSTLARGLTLQRQSCCGRTACLMIESLMVAVATDLETLDITLTDGAEQFVYTVENITAGQPFEVPINRRSTSEYIRITLPAGVRPYTLTQPYVGCGCSGASPNIRCYKMSGWNGNGNDGHIYGIQIRGQVQCCFENLLCTYREPMADLVRWRAAMALATELHTAKRVNPETLNTNALDILYENWNIEYHKRLNNWFQSARYTLAALKEPCVICTQMQYGYGH